jgi:hypothetical protein
LVDFKDLSYQGVFFIITPGEPTARMQLRCSLAQATVENKKPHSQFATELAEIRALQDAIMIRADKHKRNVSGEIIGFWKIENTPANVQLLQQVGSSEAASFTDPSGNSLYYVHSDHEHTAVIPFAFRSTGNSSNETGLDSAKDVFIFEQAQLRLGMRLDVSDRHATVGGFDEGNMQTRASEVLEEVLVGSIVNSNFYRGLLQQTTAAEELSKIGVDSNAGEHILDTIAKLPNKTAAERKRYTAACSIAMQVADVKRKQQFPDYKTTLELIKAKIHPVPNTLFHNAFEQRASSATVVQTSASFLLVDEQLTNELFANRGLGFVAGDDSQKTQRVSVPDFLLRAWGGHAALLMLLYQGLIAQVKPREDESAIVSIVEQGLDELAASSGLLELHTQATRDLLTLVYQDLSYYRDDTEHQAATGVTAALVQQVSTITRTQDPRAMYQRLSLALQQEQSNGPLHVAMQRHLAQVEPGQNNRVTPEQWVQLGKDLLRPRPWYACPSVAEMKAKLPSFCLR